ncbi:MAG: hypothetical protein LUD12_01705 [Lachnospiraceae bacterium]|nr:hypothetical protein [Lachnospiraceae bacterium]
MTIRQEYEEMKTELRVWNRRHNWDGTQFCYHIERMSKKAQTMYRRLLENDRRGIEVDRRIGVLTDEKYSQLMKVWEDCKTSIDSMTIL